MSAVPAASRIDVAAFEAGAFDPADFDHAAHVYVAWSYLRQYELVEALRRFTHTLRALTIRLGIPHKYHETITWFFMIVIAERRALDPEEDWQAFSRRNADLLRGSSSLLRCCYSAERLHSTLARRQFLLPDRP